MTTGDSEHQARLRDHAIKTWEEVYEGPDVSELFLEWVLRELSPGALLVDVGCGTGHVLAALLQRFHGPLRAVGIDASEAMISIAKRDLAAEPRATFLVGSESQLPVEAGTCDLVLSRFADYTPSELARVLRPGGRFLELGLGPLDSAEVARAFGPRYTCSFEEAAPQAWFAEREAQLARAGLRTTSFEVHDNLDLLLHDQLLDTIEMVPLVEPFDRVRDAGLIAKLPQVTRDHLPEPRFAVSRQYTLRRAERVG